MGDSGPKSVIWRSRAPICVLLCCALTPVLAQNSSDFHPPANASAAISSAPLAACEAALDENRSAESSGVGGREHPSASCMSEGDRVQFVGRFIEEKLALWQQRLKLENWKIAVAMSRRTDLKPKTLGGIRWDKGKKSAAMAVLDPSEYRLPFGEMLADIEFTIVHELVHLELASLPRSEASRSSEEHAVNQITEALLLLDRQK